MAMCNFTADDETETNEKDGVEDEVANGVTNIQMDDQGAAGDKKKSRRRAKKKDGGVPEKEPESKEKKQTDPPSVPIHELFPTGKYLSEIIALYNYIPIYILFD